MTGNQNLLNPDFNSDRVSMIAREAVSQYTAVDDCSGYFEALDFALKNEPPPFDSEAYATIYRESSVDPRWMATSLVTNAEMEGDGARRLWSLATFCSDDDEKLMLKQHAVDESRHSLMYLAFLDLAFPNAVTPEFGLELRQLSPGFTMQKTLYPIKGSPYARPPTIDDFLQMNIAEIRTTIHHIMQRRAINVHCPQKNMPKVNKILNALLTDELAHVGYTAMLIDRVAKVRGDDWVKKLFAKRFRDFNKITIEELGGGIVGCSLACCEKRKWCRAGSPASQTEAFASTVL